MVSMNLLVGSLLPIKMSKPDILQKILIPVCRVHNTYSNIGCFISSSKPL